MSKNNKNNHHRLPNIVPNSKAVERTMSLLRSNSSISQSLAMTAKGATLASIYQAKKSGNEDTKVEVLKQQFQSRLEQKITKEPQKITTNANLLNRYINETSKYIFVFFGNCEKMKKSAMRKKGRQRKKNSSQGT
jgi:tRNA U54 and U55 pseudouridine synthase Pus10